MGAHWREGAEVADEDDRSGVIFVIYPRNIAGFEICTIVFEKAVVFFLANVS